MLQCEYGALVARTLCERSPGGAVESASWQTGGEGVEARIVDWTLHKKPLDGSTLGDWQTADRHPTEEFVSFLREFVGSQPPERRIHLIADSLSAHKTKAVAFFLEENPRVTLHTPTYSS